MLQGVRGRTKAANRYEESELFRWLQLELLTDKYKEHTALSYIEVVELLSRFIGRFEVSNDACTKTCTTDTHDKQTNTHTYTCSFMHAYT